MFDDEIWYRGYQGETMESNRNHGNTNKQKQKRKAFLGESHLTQVMIGDKMWTAAEKEWRCGERKEKSLPREAAGKERGPKSMDINELEKIKNN